MKNNFETNYLPSSILCKHAQEQSFQDLKSTLKISERQKLGGDKCASKLEPPNIGPNIRRSSGIMRRERGWKWLPMSYLIDITMGYIIHAASHFQSRKNRVKMNNKPLTVNMEFHRIPNINLLLYSRLLILNISFKSWISVSQIPRNQNTQVLFPRNFLMSSISGCAVHGCSCDRMHWRMGSRGRAWSWLPVVICVGSDGFCFLGSRWWMAIVLNAAVGTVCDMDMVYLY